MDFKTFFDNFPGAITVCDPAGRILAMNERAREADAGGGNKLLGRKVLDCHPEPARTKLAAMLAEGRENVYTIEKKGVRKLIFQSPWKENGVYAGFFELSLVIPETTPHFVRGD